MKELASLENKIYAKLMISESELVFLAFVFIVTLGCFMLGRRRRDIPPVGRPNKKKRKRINCNRDEVMKMA